MNTTVVLYQVPIWLHKILNFNQICNTSLFDNRRKAIDFTVTNCFRFSPLRHGVPTSVHTTRNNSLTRATCVWLLFIRHVCLFTTETFTQLLYWNFHDRYTTIGILYDTYPITTCTVVNIFEYFDKKKTRIHH